MWKTITETEIWTDKLILWFKELKERELTFGVECPNEMVIDTEHGTCNIKISEEDILLLNTMLGRAGQYDDRNDNLVVRGNGNELLRLGSKKITVDIDIDWTELVKLEEPCVIPSCCKKLTISNAKNDDTKKISLVLLNRCDFNFEGVHHFKEFKIFAKPRNGISLKEQFYNLYIDLLSTKGVWANFNGCYIKELHTTSEVLNIDTNFYNSFVKSCKVLSILDYNLPNIVEVINAQYEKLKKNLRYLHKGIKEYNYKHMDILSMATVLKKYSEEVDRFNSDIWYVYLKVYDSISLELVKDDVLNILSYALKIKYKSDFNLDYIEQNVIIVTTEDGLKVQFIFTAMQDNEIYELLLNSEVEKYE